MNRSELLPYVSFYVNANIYNDALSAGPWDESGFGEVPDHARLVVYQCGFEPLVVAVWSYLPGFRLDADEAEELARHYLLERKWFTDDTSTDADYVI